MSECTHDCSSCSADCASRNKPESLLEAQNAFSNVKKVIAVVSGKGGVGKSLVTSLLAVLTKRNGHSTAILDADITGPSIPKMFGVHDKAMGTEDGILPVESRTGVKMMSVNLLLVARRADRGHGEAVLDRRAVGRRGLYVRGYASGNR